MNHRKSKTILFCSVFFVPILCFAEITYIPVVKVSGGENHTLILTETNNVYGCGKNSDLSQYVLGDGTQTDRIVPVQVHGVDDVNYLQNIIAVSAGWDTDWPTDPYIDPAGWLYVSGVRWEGGAEGVVGYFKFRYNSGQISVSFMEDSEAYDSDCGAVLISGETLTFGAGDPNES
jgi:hypothetical protein